MVQMVNEELREAIRKYCTHKIKCAKSLQLHNGMLRRLLIFLLFLAEYLDSTKILAVVPPVLVCFPRPCRSTKILALVSCLLKTNALCFNQAISGWDMTKTL